LATKTNPNTDEIFLENLLNAMRALLQKLLDEKLCASFQNVCSADLGVLFSMYQNCANSADSRAAVVRVVSRVGCLVGLAYEQTQSDNLLLVIQDIGKYFLEAIHTELKQCDKSEKLCLVCELLDAIMDVFAEDYVGPVINSLGLLKSLNSALPVVRNKIGQRKHELGEQKAFVLTVSTNISRFIKYHSKALGCL